MVKILSKENIRALATMLDPSGINKLVTVICDLEETQRPKTLQAELDTNPRSFTAHIHRLRLPLPPKF